MGENKIAAIQIALCALVVFGVVKCNGSDWWQESERQREAQEQADSTPHIIRQADGCKVYAWKGGDGVYHYFTRCGETVTTERTYSETCGKNCTRKKSEIIVTKGNK